MREITEEVTQKRLVTKYVADDGNVFGDKNECARYCDLIARYNNLVAGRIDEYDMI